MERLIKEVENLPEIVTVKSLGFESFHAAGEKIDRVWGLFTAKDSNQKKESFILNKGIFQAARMNVKEKNLVVILRISKFAYSEVESTPDRFILDSFFRDFISKLT